MKKKIKAVELRKNNELENHYFLFTTSIENREN